MPAKLSVFYLKQPLLKAENYSNGRMKESYKDFKKTDPGFSQFFHASLIHFALKTSCLLYYETMHKIIKNLLNKS